MSDGIGFAGVEVHARKTAVAAVQSGSGEVFKAQLSGSSAAAIVLPDLREYALRRAGDRNADLPD